MGTTPRQHYRIEQRATGMLLWEGEYSSPHEALSAMEEEFGIPGVGHSETLEIYESSPTGQRTYVARDMDTGHGRLVAYDDGSFLRYATAEEKVASQWAAAYDRGEGVIRVGGLRCRVEE